VSVSGIIEFQNRARVISIVESDRADLCLFSGDQSHINIVCQYFQEKIVLEFDTFSNESTKAKFLQMY
jgi:hypothetical protein